MTEGSKIGSYIGFDDFSSQDADLTNDQIFLHEECESFVDSLGLKLKQKFEDNIAVQISKDYQHSMEAFERWKRILSKLAEQSYLTYYWFMHKIQYNKKPARFRMRPIHFSTDQLDFKFSVKEYQEYFTVRMKAILHGKNMEISNFFPHRHPFFITLKNDPRMHYLLPSIGFGIYINDFIQEGFTIKVCKTVFEGFKKHVLESLAVNYPVQYKLLDRKTVRF